MNAVVSDIELRSWFVVARHAYAIIDTQAVPQVEAILTSAGAAEWGRLARGAAPADGAEAWCVELTPELAFSRWLLAGDGTMLEDWGVLAFSEQPFREVRNHLRDLLEVQLPRGERVAFRWYRPPALRALLPLCSAPQLTEVFGPVTAFALHDGDRGSWVWLRLIGGRLDTQVSAPVRAPA